MREAQHQISGLMEQVTHDLALLLQDRYVQPCREDAGTPGEDHLNTMPRKLHDWHSAHSVYAELTCNHR